MKKYCLFFLIVHKKLTFSSNFSTSCSSTSHDASETDSKSVSSLVSQKIIISLTA